MEIGMLWFDDSSSALSDKVARALAHYESKYGRKATLCLVHPETLNGGDGIVRGVELRSARSVMPHHYWIGVEEEAGREPSRQRAAA
jgi:hypothetical protein